MISKNYNRNKKIRAVLFTLKIAGKIMMQNKKNGVFLLFLISLCILLPLLMVNLFLFLIGNYNELRKISGGIIILLFFVFSVTSFIIQKKYSFSSIGDERERNGKNKNLRININSVHGIILYFCIVIIIVILYYWFTFCI
jgi:hypothetical protein